MNHASSSSKLKKEGLAHLDMIKRAFDQIGDWVLITDTSGMILYVNPAVEKLSGYSAQELLGNNPSVLKSELVSREVYQELWETILGGEVYSNVVTNRHKRGNLYYIASEITPIKDKDGKIDFFISTGRQIKDEGKTHSQMHKVIHYDALTGLLNRNSFVEKIGEKRKKYQKTAVIAITINKLGLINSRFGFVCGDKVIKEVGTRIKDVLDENCLISRPEGKVFAVLYPDFGNAHKIVQLITKIEGCFKDPIIINQQPLYISLSFGIATCPSDKVSEIDVAADALLTRAQLALSQAKKSSRLENYEFYTTSMNQEASDEISLENEIRQAYKENEFISYYQPFVDIKTGKIVGLEALMRRKKSTGEIVFPLDFISLLEEMGLIIEVGFSLIEQICFQMSQWIKVYGESVPVSINLSPVQFKDEHFCEKMMEIVERYKIPPNLIDFEITETVLIEDVNRTILILESLTDHGFRVSIDDFGTGYSSLSYIQKFKINRLKIDMSFVQNIVTSEQDQTIVKAIIMMANGLDLETVAEGVETKEQLALLKLLGANVGQGYYWDKPLSGQEITKKYFA